LIDSIDSEEKASNCTNCKEGSFEDPPRVPSWLNLWEFVEIPSKIDNWDSSSSSLSSIGKPDGERSCNSCANEEIA
jgi:hypothetical protein